MSRFVHWGIFLWIVVLLHEVKSQEKDVQWGEWSPCSRTCGVGVSYQNRLCLDVTADGSQSCPEPRRKYRTCNIQDCPEGSGDFRYEQCAMFNNRTLDGKKYYWVPYIPGHDSCGLNCMPKGEYFYYRWADRVVDGTKCGPESYDICVAGKCKPLGCDLILNSIAKEDKCRVCNGNGENCRVIRGEYHDNGDGYHEFLVIPTGATNIKIEEVKPSANFLAMADGSGKFFFNGNYVVTNPRTYKFAGSLFRYERTSTGKETIFSLGPTNVPVLVVGLMTAGEQNPGITYEYSVPTSVKLPKDEKFSWRTAAYSPCSATCAGGSQRRQVYCVRERNNRAVRIRKCNQSTKPLTKRKCNTKPCPPRWFISGWSACSVTCGQGKQVRRVHCEQVVEGGDVQMISDDQCPGDKSSTMRVCIWHRYCPVWSMTKWSRCSMSCGEGTITRDVTCRQVHDNMADRRLNITDENCDANTKPSTRERCNPGPCTTRWSASAWSECFPKCGRGMRTRMVYCVSVTDVNQKYPDTLCDNRTRPVHRKDCFSIRVCPPMWHASQWSRCTATCGVGMQMRNVLCARHEDSLLRVVADGQCDIAFKMRAIQTCSTRPCRVAWYIYPWQPCSSSCGIGLRRRTVKCIGDSKETDEQWCDTDQPGEVERCLVQHCATGTSPPFTTRQPTTQIRTTQPTTQQPTEPPTTKKQTTRPATTQRPTTQRPTVAPTTTKPPTTLPMTTRPTTTRPTTTKSTTTRPTTTRPTTTKPTTTRPTTTRPTTTRPTTTRPTTTRPTTTKPTTTRPTTTRPTTTRPTTTRPTTTRPTTTRPTTTRPTTTRPTTTRPTTTRPTTARPTTAEPTTIPTTIPTTRATTRKPTTTRAPTVRPTTIQKVSTKIVEGPRNITTYVRSQVLMTCRATGIPEPSVSWRRGPLPVSALGPRYQILEDGTLRIDQVMIEDEGKYECFATNFYGPIKTKSAILRIVVPARVRLSPRGNYQVSVGDPVTITCQYEGKPEPAVQWNKDRRLFYVNNARISTSRHRITITRALISDEGLYQCTAYHRYGRAVDVVTLTVKGSEPTMPPTEKVCEDDDSVAKCSIVKSVNYCVYEYYKKACCKTCGGP